MYMDDRKFTFRVPGQPPTVNHLYKEATRTTIGKNGNVRTYRTKVKEDGVQTYQDSVTWYTKMNVPRDWEPGERVRLRYWFHLKRDIDCDNALKAINDAVAHALRVDDKSFLPSVEAKWTGEKDPFVVVEIHNEQQPAHDDRYHSVQPSASHR